MSVRVRLTRVGSKKNPAWRVVVADQRSPRDGRIIESLGHYNPQMHPSTIVIDRERLQHWIDQGAQPTNTVRKLMRAPDTVVQAGDAVTAAPEPPASEDEPAAAQEGDVTPAGAAGSEADAGPSGAPTGASEQPATTPADDQAARDS